MIDEKELASHINRMNNIRDAEQRRQMHANESKEERKARIQQIVAEKREQIRASLPIILKENEEIEERLASLENMQIERWW